MIGLAKKFFRVLQRVSKSSISRQDRLDVLFVSSPVTLTSFLSFSCSSKATGAITSFSRDNMDVVEVELKTLMWKGNLC